MIDYTEERRDQTRILEVKPPTEMDCAVAQALPSVTEVEDAAWCMNGYNDHDYNSDVLTYFVSKTSKAA